MPQPQIPHHHAPLLHDRLHRRPHRPPLLSQLLPDPATRAFSVRALLIRDAAVLMRTQPDLGAAVVGCHGDEWHVDNEGEWVRRVSEVGVGVDGLALWGGEGWGGRHRGVAGCECELWGWTEEGGGEVRCEGVW